MPTDPDDATMRDRLAIRDIVESWAILRDSGQWEALRALWHADGVMSATWQQASAADFVAASQGAWARGIDVQHLLGGMSIEIAGDRAIAQTKMTITQRALVHDVLVDVVCAGRFYDFFERRDRRWGIVLRQPTYERDRMDPVDPSAILVLDPALLSQFPRGYCHLAYLQTTLGLTVKSDMPDRTGAEVERLYARGRAWLAGAAGHPCEAMFGQAESP